MRTKSIIAILIPVFATLLWALLRDTYIAIAIEEATEKAAAWLGIPRADMIAAATPYVLSIGVIAATVVTTYHVAVRERTLKPAFEFLYDETSPRFVRADPQAISYYFGLHVLADHTIDSPNVWMLESYFTERLFVHGLTQSHPAGVQIYSGGALDPDVTEPIRLCILPPRRQFLNLRSPDDPLGSVQQFVLEARGRNCKPIRATFEYDPDRTPMIRMLR